MRRFLLLTVLIGGAMGGTPGCTKQKPMLRVLNWADYFAPDTIANFEREYGCKVVVTNFASGDELREKIWRVPSGYDVAFPDDEILPQLIESGRLSKLDPVKVPNLKNIAARFKGTPIDSKNEYSVPYMWGTTGIAYSKKEVQPAPESWAILWDPKYTSKMTMLDDRREAFVVAMLVNGDDPKKPTRESIDRAKKKLMERKPLAYDSSPKQKLIVGDAWISHCYNGDALQVEDADPEERKSEVGYVIPKEGSTIWFDSVVIPAQAENADLAHAFINYLLRPGVSAAITNATKYANPNELAQQHIHKAIRENPLVYPSEETLKRCFNLPALDFGLRKYMDEAWEEVRKK